MKGTARFCSFLLLAAAGSCLTAQDSKRSALIIGNDSYTQSPLKNAVNDARAMDKALRAAGFQTRLVENASKEQMEDAFGAFADALGPDSVALFYYAGHAFQIENENFLVPVDYKPARGIAQAKTRTVSVVQLIEEMKRARAQRSIIILDACRANPITDSYSLTAGLAQPLNPGKETYIAFSTSPNRTAPDNPDGKNSFFTEALADFISQPSLTIDINETLDRVRKRVQSETEGRQTPWSLSSLSSPFYFRGGSRAAENDATLAQKWLEDAAMREQRQDWNEAIELLNQVARRKPGGSVEAAATARLPYLVARREAQASFDSSNYAKTAELSQQAFQIDPFAVDAAFLGANSYLLADRIPDAVNLLKAVRVRGSAESARKAGAMLKELAAVSPEAAQEIKSGAPKPPKVEELFAGHRFGVPDWDAGKRYTQSTPVELARFVNQIQANIPATMLATTATPAAAPAAPAPPPTPGAPAPLHFDVVAIGATRELDYRPADESPAPEKSPPTKGGTPRPRPRREPPPLGFVQFEGGSPDTTVLLNGKPISQESPGKLQVPAGQYEVRAVRGEEVIDRQTVEVKPSAITKVMVKR